MGHSTVPLVITYIKVLQLKHRMTENSALQPAISYNNNPDPVKGLAEDPFYTSLISQNND
jgi:hypothetical protein